MSHNQSLEFRVGRDEIVLRQRYTVLSILNDIMVGLWFIVGSVLFFSTATTRAGIWCFLIGSVQLLIRPLIELTKQVHLTRVRSTPVTSDASNESRGAPLP